MEDDLETAERIAAVFNDQDPRMRRWASQSAGLRRIYVARWARRLEAIRKAGFDVVKLEAKP